MSTTVYIGKDFFEAHQAIAQAKEQHRQKFGEMSVELFDVQGLEPKSLQQSVLSVPFLADKKLVVLRGEEPPKDHHEALIEIVENVPETTEMVVYFYSLDRRSALYRRIKSSWVTLKEAPKSTPRDIAVWAREIANNMNVKMHDQALRYLIERLQGDQWRIYQELFKLSALGQAVTTEHIDTLVTTTPRDTIFEMLDAVAARKPDKAMEIFEQLRAQQIDPHYILSMIAWQLHIFAIVAYAAGRSSDEIAKGAKLSPFVVRKVQAAFRDVTHTQLHTMLAHAARADIIMKTSSADPLSVVAQLVQTLSRT